MSRFRFLLSVALVAGAGIRPLAAQERVRPPEILAGEWSGPLQMDSGTRNLSLEFHLTDSAFTGTVYMDGDSFGTMQNASVRADTVHFTLDRLDFTGVIHGPRMNVALIMYNGSTRHLTLEKRAEPGAERPR